MPDWILRSLLAAAAGAGRRGRLSILIFHRVLEAPDALFPDEVCRTRFDEILRWLKRWFNVLPLGEAVHRLREQTLPARPACITFDDGYADNFTNALPLLRHHGLHATFFIATGFLDGGRMWNDTLIESVRRTAAQQLDLSPLGLGVVDAATVADKRRAIARLVPALKHRSTSERLRASQEIAGIAAADLPDDLMLTSAQVRGLRDAGMAIGAHTVNHPILAAVSEREAYDEILEGRRFLEALLGERVGLFAYPNGKPGSDYTPAHAAMVADLGFDAAVSTLPGTSRGGDDLYQLRRFTPWDRTRARFGLRLVKNLIMP